ncbi:FDLD family class I lanthipeptide [Tumebacillus sp. ITR2]|uniref:FDLD family class I lanthipeptide n=1 Tax=Tumebacillus amylolyticus TaxID=2801339 RepID=A0ABS1JGD7_9BACL|nr:FDLD family class I lanthipeptide [Tumebacillus amylolyticus]MBL0388648.1 FDLD family class I lanthipeptide [Tumebacillus amylolyticus]
MENMFELDVQVKQSQPTTMMQDTGSGSGGTCTCLCTISGCDWRTY